MDIRIASTAARMGFVFARRGVVPEACSTWFLPRLVGISQAAEWVYTGRVFQFFGEALRQTGILILGSTIVIWGLVFILGLQCGIEGAYFNRSVGSPAYAGVFAAWCDLREVIPYAFGYMLAERGQKLDEAVSFVERALKLDPGNPAYLDSLGPLTIPARRSGRPGEGPADGVEPALLPAAGVAKRA